MINPIPETNKMSMNNSSSNKEDYKMDKKEKSIENFGSMLDDAIAFLEREEAELASSIPVDVTEEFKSRVKEIEENRPI